MDHETKKHIGTLAYLIRYTNEEPYRSALVAAHNRLLRDIHNDSAARRTASDWPCCPVCRRPYISKQSTYEYIKELTPPCEHGKEPIWERRPDGEWNTVKEDVM